MVVYSKDYNAGRIAMFIGFSILLLACICQGSFGLGYKNFKPFSWEAFWGIYCFYCLLIPMLWALILVPDVCVHLTDDLSLTLSASACGVLWGASAICFSKAVSMIGMSLVYGISMGISAIVGSLIPLFTAEELPKSRSLILLIIGLVITLIGIAVITKAGLTKDREMGVSADGNMKLGLLFSMISGLGSGAMNIGFDRLSPIGRAVIENGGNDTAASAIQWLPVLAGGAVAGMIFCAVSMTRQKTWRTYTENGSIRRFGILFVTAIVWFIALAAYGIASIKLGELGPVIGWILFNALALIISNLWGLKIGEWKGCAKAKRILFSGNAILIISWVFTALSNM